jgi:hypothetical protein
MKPKMHLMLDSGAFSAWNSGEIINIDDFVKFVKQTPAFEVVVNLDVIPGSRVAGVVGPTPEEAAKGSWENYRYLLKKGVKAMPVFHYCEDWKWLDKILESGCRYFALGAIAKVRRDSRIRWLDQVFTRLTNEKGIPYVKVHGLGVTDTQILQRYPWFSVDSTGWLIQSSYGRVNVGGSSSIGLSTTKPFQYSALERQSIEKELNQSGVNIDLISSSRRARMIHEASRLLSWYKSYEVQPFRYRQSSLFVEKTNILMRPLKLWKNIVCYFGVTAGRIDTTMLVRAGVRHVLISFADVTGNLSEAAMVFHKTGAWPGSDDLPEETCVAKSKKIDTSFIERSI